MFCEDINRHGVEHGCYVEPLATGQYELSMLILHCSREIQIDIDSFPSLPRIAHRDYNHREDAPDAGHIIHFSGGIIYRQRTEHIFETILNERITFKNQRGSVRQGKQSQLCDDWKISEPSPFYPFLSM